MTKFIRETKSQNSAFKKESILKQFNLSDDPLFKIILCFMLKYCKKEEDIIPAVVAAIIVRYAFEGLAGGNKNAR